MEVHHHPEVEKKGFKEYILEGLMIFLAVTMGFFAESLREHITNNEREEQYVRSMIEDLKIDRTTLENYLKKEKESMGMLDSLIIILNDPADISRRGDDLYYFGRLGPRLRTLSVSMRTFEQLEHSGNFRLISDMEVSNKIMSHYDKIPIIRQLEDIYAQEFVSYKKVAANVFEPAVFSKQEGDKGVIKRGTGNPPLQKNASGFIKELAVDAIYMNGSRKGILNSDENLLKSVNDLLDYLQKRYH